MLSSHFFCCFFSVRDVKIIYDGLLFHHLGPGGSTGDPAGEQRRSERQSKVVVCCDRL